MSSRRRRTPQERKRLSLARDTVDVGEYPKVFRRQHPLRRARAERAARRAVRGRLAEGTGGAGRTDGAGRTGSAGGADGYSPTALRAWEVPPDVPPDVDTVRRRVVRKWPPVRLGDLIAAKADRRLRLRDNPRKSPDARERRRERRR